MRFRNSMLITLLLAGVAGCSHPELSDPPTFTENLTCDVRAGNMPLELATANGYTVCVVMREIATNRCMIVQGGIDDWHPVREIDCPTDEALRASGYTEALQ